MASKDIERVLRALGAGLDERHRRAVLKGLTIELNERHRYLRELLGMSPDEEIITLGSTDDMGSDYFVNQGVILALYWAIGVLERATRLQEAHNEGHRECSEGGARAD